MNSLILSSGLGTRLRPITYHTPKPMVEISDIPMVCFSMYPLISYTNTFVFNLSYLASKLHNAFLRFPVKKQFVLEGDKPLGVTRGILNARSFLEDDENFFVANGDTVFLPENKDFIKECLDFHISSNSIATFVVIDFKSDHIKLKLDDENNLKALTRDKGFHFIGYYIVNKKFFDFLSYDSDLFKCVFEAQKEHVVKCFVTEGLWFEVGNEPDLLKAREYMKSCSSDYLDNLLKTFS